MPTFNKKRSTYRRKASTDARQNKEIKVLKSQVKSIIKSSEKKYYDQGLSVPVSTTALMQPLNSMTVFAGTNALRYSTREGQSINMRSYRAKCLLTCHGSGVSPDANNRIRVMVVYSKDDTTPSAGNILQTPTKIDSQLRIAGKFNYDVLYDRTFNLQSSLQVALTTPTEPWRIPFKININMGKTGKLAEWIPTAGSSTPPVKGALTMLLLSDSSVVTHPGCDVISRLRYDDL